jgi:hypothetical protein
MQGCQTFLGSKMATLSESFLHFLVKTFTFLQFLGQFWLVKDVLKIYAFFNFEFFL